MTSRVFTAAAMALCAQDGHAFVLVRTWHAVGFDECSRCGATKPVAEHPPAFSEQHGSARWPADGPAAPRPARAEPSGLRRQALRFVDQVTGEVLSMRGRDEAIVRLHLSEGVPLGAIGERFGITPQRAGQVCKRVLARAQGAPARPPSTSTASYRSA